MATAGLYARISQDDRDDAAGVERQRKDCESYCARHDLEIAGTFIDNDVSASRYARKKRPEYRRLIEATHNGVDVIVAYNIDRLYRQPRELEELIDLAEHGTVEVHTLNGPLDLRTGDGRANARILVTMAAKSTDDDSRRWRSLKDHLAVSGKRAGGPRPFGYDAPPGEPMTIRDDEADALRRAADAVLAGESVTGIATAWNAADIKPPRSKKGTWSTTQVISVLTNPVQAGMRVHRSEVVGKGDWPRILDRATHERLVSLLTDPARKRRTPPRRSLLTGIVYCSECDGPMTRDRNNGKPVLRCRRGPGLPGCGRVSIQSTPVESMVTAYVIGRLDVTTGVAAAHADLHAGDRDSAAGALEELELRLTDVGEMFAAGVITRGEYTRMRASINAKIKDARRDLRPARARDALDAIIGKLGDVWDGLSDDRKREIIAAVVDKVTISPATRRRGFDPDRITIT
jgi:site-specific DNA recombinase